MNWRTVEQNLGPAGVQRELAAGLLRWMRWKRRLTRSIA